MSNSMTDLSPQSLVTAIEDNFVEFWATYGRTPGMALYDEQGVLWFETGVPSVLFNGVIRTWLSPGDIEARIDAVLDHFKARQLRFQWNIPPSARPADQGQYLEARGFRHPFDLPGMAVDLLALNEEWPAQSGLKIETVSDRVGLERWVEALGVGFEIRESARAGFLEMETSLGLEPSPSRQRFLGWLDGEPVATSLLFISAGVAGLYFVSTVPQARRQGIGTAITLAPLQAAREMGYRVGILQASPDGYSVYRRIGFQDYCEIGLYFWL